MRIIRFNFTYAIPGGAWVEREDGSKEWLSFYLLAKCKGEQWIEDMLRKQGMFKGCWVDC